MNHVSFPFLWFCIYNENIRVNIIYDYTNKTQKEYDLFTEQSITKYNVVIYIYLYVYTSYRLNYAKHSTIQRYKLLNPLTRITNWNYTSCRSQYFPERRVSRATNNREGLFIVRVQVTWWLCLGYNQGEFHEFRKTRS